MAQRTQPAAQQPEKRLVVKDVERVGDDAYKVRYRIVGERYDRELEITAAQLVELREEAINP